MFQHTAARRRLLDTVGVPMLMLIVSTHSRPKAAAPVNNNFFLQPHLFQHTAARRRLLAKNSAGKVVSEFQHTAARRRLRGETLCIR